MGVLVAVFATFAATAQELIVISAGDCARVVAHVPDADVAYEAGVDARGCAGCRRRPGNAPATRRR
jgi:hypothetical protein